MMMMNNDNTSNDNSSYYNNSQRSSSPSTKHGNGPDDAQTSSSLLKRAMSRYRRRGAVDRLDDWNELIDPGRPDEWDCLTRVTTTTTMLDTVQVESSSSSSSSSSADDCCCCHYQGPVYALRGKPGFYVAPQALSHDLQLRLSYAALTEYCEHPHKTNIDGVPPKPHETMNEPHETFWYLWKTTQPEEGGGVGVEDSKQQQKRQQHTSSPKYRSFKKLSWATMGYQYDWTQRKYHVDAYSPVPVTLQRIGQIFARTAMLFDEKLLATNTTTSLPEKDSSTTTTTTTVQQQPPQLQLQQVPNNYTVSACIVNYYNTKSVMGAHQDDLEYDLTKPIVSLCLGKRPCVFVLGGNTADDDDDDDDAVVVPLVLRPGDVVIMGGATRLAFHAMARLLPTHLPAEPTVTVNPQDQIGGPDITTTTTTTTMDQTNSNNDTILLLPDDLERQALDRFLSHHRININLRQVYPDGEDPRSK